MAEDENNGRPSAKEHASAAMSQGQAEAGREPAPTADVQAYIGRQLKAVYDDVAKQPIPDRFLALMQQLESKGAG